MDKFLNAIKEGTVKLKGLSGKTIKLVSHLDSDGLSSSAIMIRAFEREGINFSLTTVRQLDDNN